MGGKTPEWMPELFFSHRHEFCVIADQLGFRLGTRSDHFKSNRTQRLLDDGYEIDFLDNDFEDPDEERLERILKKTNPEFVVLPDIYEDTEVEDVFSLGHKFADEYGATPIVVPKCEFDYNDIPPSWIVGFSVPSGYGGTEIEITEFQGHRIHLLGGSHRNQIKYANKAVDANIDIFSVDGNAFSKASGFGNIINEPVEMLDNDGRLNAKAWVADADGYTDWGQRIAQSLARYYELWRQWGMKRIVGMSSDEVSRKM